ncbi:peptide deformylase [Kribbella sp. NPDC051770]|uniref:peptide deformylase n=1 Tax=Kribbella sp. NPDC051770 TaxID=3155413 RepID=UPI003449C896
MPADQTAQLRGFDLEGRHLQVEASGYFARCLVHETEHLDGTLYIDHLTPAARTHALSQSASTRDAVLAQRAARQRRLGK